MKRSMIGTAILALSLITAPVSYAQGNDRGRGDGRESARGNSHDNGRGNGPGNRGWANGHYKQAQRGYPGWQGDRSYRGGHDGPGAGRNHDYYRGDRLPNEYRNTNYVVDDWRGHRLSPPPRGYHWVQTGPDYVLVAIASGIIAQILLGH